MKNKKNKGFSLVEILIVLGVVAAMAITAFVIYPRASDRYKVNDEIKKINAALGLVDSMPNLNTSNYSGASGIMEAKILEDVGFKEFKENPNPAVKRGNWGTVFLTTYQGSNGISSSIIRESATFTGSYPKEIIYMIESSYKGRYPNSSTIYRNSCIDLGLSKDPQKLKEKLIEEAIRKVNAQIDDIGKTNNWSEEQIQSFKDSMVESTKSTFDTLTDEDLLQYAAQQERGSAWCTLTITKYV